MRLGAMVQLLTARLPERGGGSRWPGTSWSCAARPPWWTASCGPSRPPGWPCCAPWPACPGWVVARAELLAPCPAAGNDEHAVETAMARLRAALGTPNLVATVVKRGYRLAVDPTAEPGEKYGAV
ncbi:hypothetical protein GCM10020229_15460 [Kitasatospora albolonga]